MTVQFPRLKITSLTVLGSGFHSLDSEFQLLDFKFLIGGTRIPDSYSWDSGFQEWSEFQTQDSGFQSTNFPDYAIRITLHGAIKKVSNDDFTVFFSAVSSGGSSDDKASP